MTLEFIKKARRQFCKVAPNMTPEERFKYISEGADEGNKKLEQARKEKQNKTRNFSVLIRLTQDERVKLETDAQQEKTTLSSLIRSRALQEKNHFQTVLQHLKKIESKLNIKK